MSTLKVDGIRSNSASSDAITLASDGTCTANITNNLSNRNLIINGAMQVAQRGTSSTTSGYGDVDRWQHEYAGTDEAPTFAQVEVVSSDSGDNPFAKGFSNCARITNGNQTSGLQAASQINFMQPIEAQNIRNSGWNYNSSSSYITLSYYVKASVAQEYHGFVKTADGSNYVYPFSLGSLSANTWTKITKTIPGNSNLQIDNNNGAGFQVWPVALYGTDYTDSGVNNDAWASWASSSRNKDNTSTWWTTNDSTFEITGVQLEVGSKATDFEHRSYGQELQLCKRYYQQYENLQISGGFYPTTQMVPFTFPVEFRANPTASISNTGSSAGQYVYDGDGYSNVTALDSAGLRTHSCHMTFSLAGDMTNYRSTNFGGSTNTANATTYKFNAEL
jgi:hypothetical protein